MKKIQLHLHPYFLMALAIIGSAMLLSVSVQGQDDLDDLLDDMEEEKVEYTKATFKSTRVINLHSVEKVTGGELEFRISHRFGALNGGAYELFGLDQATIRFGLEYGINDWLMVGFGRSSFEKTYDFFAKGNILRQSTGKRNMPVSVLYFAGMYINTLNWVDPDRDNLASSRFSYAYQLIIGRKFSNRLSLQLSPTVVHRNLVQTREDANTIYALGTSGRVKLTNRLAINAEYIYRLPSGDAPNIENFKNSFSLGFDLETGGHVFQLHCTNSLPMIEKGFVTETTQSWLDGGIHFGFNITRRFVIVR